MHRLFEKVDIAPLVWFRVVFGATLLWEFWRHHHYGWIHRYWIAPTFHFKYWGLEWLEPWSGDGMYLHFGALAVLAFVVWIGFAYRIAAVLLCAGYAYVLLLEQARFQNHTYLLALLCLLMIGVPAHRSLSIDAWWRPGLRSDRVEAWPLWLLRAQLAIVYVYGGIAKLNADWLRGEPIRTFLDRRAQDPITGMLAGREWVVYLVSYGGLLFDLFIVPLLMWRRTRVPALLAVAAFHLTNAWVFHIGVFPWFMLAATPIFFEPDWLRKKIPGLLPLAPDPLPARSTARRRWVLGLAGAYLLVQLVLPLRHLFQPGNVLWIEHGRLFSWHMKLHAKEVEGWFVLSDPASGRSWPIDPRGLLPRWQVDRMLATPDMILQFGHHIAAQARRRGLEHPEVRAHITASLHGRQPQRFVDPYVDLATQRRTLSPPRWIVPLEQPLPPTRRRE